MADNNGFLNPYGFVSIPDRDTLPEELGDHEPAGHDRYREDLWTGDIPITIKTITPLLIPDHWAAAREDTGGEHAPALPVRVDSDGRPILSGSAVKGMLRADYEAITNSRLGVFTGHDLPLTVRATATFAGPPVASLPATHRPASELAELSPADRVFGWVRQGAAAGEAAYRGHLRVQPGDDTDCRPAKESVQELTSPLPLTTLNGPKPAQFLFYLGDQNGRPLDGSPKRPDHGYPPGPDALATRRLRGRKVYLTHADVLGAADYWTPAEKPGTPITVDDARRYREYHAPEGQQEKVTTTVSHWVVPGTTFRCTLRVDNLSGTELGALLWLLDLPSVDNRPAYHKLGLGKPLGFGVVQVMIDLSQARLYTDATLRDRYRSLAPNPPAEPAARLAQLRKDYNDLLRAHDDLRRVRKEFLAAAAGFPGYPVHYPRLTPRPATESYKWWVTNDGTGKTADKQGGRHALPGLRQAPVLPYDPSLTDGARNPADPRPHQGDRVTPPRRRAPRHRG